MKTPTTARQLAVPSVCVEGGRYTGWEGFFWDVMQCGPIFDEHGNLTGVTKTRGVTHLRSYGTEAPFFAGLPKGRIVASRCVFGECPSHGKIYLPFAGACPGCLHVAEPVDVTAMVAETAVVYTYIVTSRTGAFNTLPTPIRFVDMRTPGIPTFFKGYMSCEGEPEIGMRLVPIFRTKEPTYTILDISWVAVGTPPENLPEGFTYALA